MNGSQGVRKKKARPTEIRRVQVVGDISPVTTVDRTKTALNGSMTADLVYTGEYNMYLCERYQSV